MKKISSTFLMVGSGNMAFSLGTALVENGYKAHGVLSRNLKTGQELAVALKTNLLANLDVKVKPDFIFLCVSDSQISDVASQFSEFNDSIVCHCSGATPLSVLIGKVRNAAVFYPMQSVKRDMIVNWNEVPILIESEREEITHELILLANTISTDVSECSSDKRELYHVAAVILNNFSNHLVALSQDYCVKNKLDFQKLNPLLTETLKRVRHGSAKVQQTGPAIRNDQNTITKHLALISDFPELLQVYKVLTDSIQKIGKR